jgi:O-antigen/teichoic acid export membrane protein
MSDVADTAQARLSVRIATLLRDRQDLIRGYLAALSGTAGRLIFSLAYFVILANTLALGDFGIFATASAAGVVLSRIVGFGFISTLYRVAAVRPGLLGVYAAGFLLMMGLSLPVLGVATLGVHALFFAASAPLAVFAAVVVAEAVIWRPVEAVIIVNNGLGHFGRAAALTIAGTALRSALAVVFLLGDDHSLAAWTVYYLAANALALAIALLWFVPKRRLRFRPYLYWRRLPDAVYVAGAEILFYLQMEFDKLLVLAVGGPRLAGLYAILMRLIDLTAIPVRAFTMMLVQRMMRVPDMLKGLRMRGGIELLLFTASTASMAVIVVFLNFFPGALGSNVAKISSLLGLALLVPGLRNLTEYQAELLFARGQTGLRAVNLALLAGVKAVLLLLALKVDAEAPGLVWNLNGVFAAIYLASLALTYSAMRLPAKAL